MMPLPQDFSCADDTISGCLDESVHDGFSEACIFNAFRKNDLNAGVVEGA
jgi:hypothetical protein